MGGPLSKAARFFAAVGKKQNLCTTERQFPDEPGSNEMGNGT